MKILVIQLLRLGDILMSAPVLAGLRKKYPNAEIHFLGFKNCSHIESLFSDAIHWHWIDRDHIQSAIAGRDYSFMQAQDILEKQLKSLKMAKLDLVLNLTQTRFSGWICNHLGVAQTVGLQFDGQGRARFGSNWFQYLNDYTAAGKGETFHYIDLFRYGSSLEDQGVQWKFVRQPIAIPDGPYVLVQALTSDEKKSYPLVQWRQALSSFLLTHPDYNVVILAAPSEQSQLEAEFGGMSRVRVAPCSLGQALTLMDGADLLVTGDTSIKHLACDSDISVIELSLGSSDLRKTGIYKSGSWIMQGRAPCMPCSHYSPCSQKQHECSRQISPEAVALAMHMMILNPGAVEKIAVEFRSQIQWFETYLSPMGFWLAKDLDGASIEWTLLQCIEKSTWKFLLQREYMNPIAPFGSESLHIRRTFEDRFPSTARVAIREQLDFLESETAVADQHVHVVLNSMSRLLERPMDLTRQEECLESVRQFCEREGGNGVSSLNWLTALDQKDLWPNSDSNVIPLGSIRRLQSQLDDIFRRTQIKLKLIRSLKLQVIATEGL
jgi:ADP-heptose:LPS heptosyltransferase